MKSKNYCDYAWRKKREVVYQTLNMFLDRFKEKVRLLDVGCGDGTQTKKYYEIILKKGKVAFVVGIDINAHYLSHNGIIDFIVGDARYLPFKDESFDLIISTEVIEHFIEGELFLNECYRILKESGVLILTTPNRSRITALPRSLIYKIKGVKYVPGPNPEHVREYTPTELVKILEECGFTVKNVDFIAFNPYLPIPTKLCFMLDKISDKFRGLGKLLKWDMLIVAEK